MAGPAFRESGKPAPGKVANKDGAGTVIPATSVGANRAIIIYDVVWLDVGDANNYSRLREQSASLETNGELILMVHRGLSMSFSSPIQLSQGMGIYTDEAGETAHLTITYEIVDV